MIFGRTSAVFLYVKYIFMTKSSILRSTKHILQYTEDLVLRHPRCISRWAFHDYSVRKMWLNYTLVFLNFLSKLIFLTPFRISWRIWHFLAYAVLKLIWKCSKHHYQCNLTSLFLWNNKYLNSENIDKCWLSYFCLKQIVFSTNYWRENFCDDYKWFEMFASVVKSAKNFESLY